ncbi:MAG: hypothetical protein JWO38_633 [Gemmataceae bacterium]|nr:hypothetical protein [Gemmataceae bacterium]
MPDLIFCPVRPRSAAGIRPTKFGGVVTATKEPFANSHAPKSDPRDSGRIMNDDDITALAQRLDRIESVLTALLEREMIRDWYEVEEFAKLVGKVPFTCREWCRLGRIKAEKKASGRGKFYSWVISHDELIRYRREGLLPGGPRTDQPDAEERGSARK